MKLNYYYIQVNNLTLKKRGFIKIDNGGYPHITFDSPPVFLDEGVYDYFFSHVYKNALNYMEMTDGSRQLPSSVRYLSGINDEVKETRVWVSGYRVIDFYDGIKVKLDQDFRLDCIEGVGKEERDKTISSLFRSERNIIYTRLFK